MGNWQLEVGKFAFYIMFPVGLFYVFNQPQYFEEWVIKKRREMYPPQEEEKRKELRDFVANYQRSKMEKELLEKLESTK